MGKEYEKAKEDIAAFAKEVAETLPNVPRAMAEAAKSTAKNTAAVAATGVGLAAVGLMNTPEFLLETSIAGARFGAGLLKIGTSDARGLVANYGASLVNMHYQTTTYEQWHNPKLLLAKYSPEEDQRLREMFKPHNIFEKNTINTQMQALYAKYKNDSVKLLGDGVVVATLNDKSPELSEALKLGFPEITFNDPINSVGDIQKAYTKMVSQIENYQKNQEHTLHEDLRATFNNSQKALNDAHTKALDQLREGMITLITEQHLEAQRQRDQLSFLHRIYMHDANIKATIDTMVIAKGQQITDLKKVNLLDASKEFFNQNEITTLTGQKISRLVNDDSNEPSYQLNFPSPMFNSHYYHSVKDNVKADLLALAELIKATPPKGCDKIEMQLSSKDMVRKAYEACLEAGFDKDKIKITLNGKTLSVNEIFPNHQALATAEDKARFNKSARENGGPLDKGGEAMRRLKDFKDELTATRAAKKEDAGVTVEVEPVTPSISSI